MPVTATPTPRQLAAIRSELQALAEFRARMDALDREEPADAAGEVWDAWNLSRTS
jgi:hypothetical protein